jgi:hypothetical protein
MSQTTSIPKDERTLSRRELLKALTALGGAAVASSLLPERWAQPEIGAGVLPAHAQATCIETEGSLEVIARTTTLVSGQYADFDLRVFTPDGTRITNNNRGPHQGVTHGGPNSPNDPSGPPVANDTETASMPPGGAVNGTYRIQIDNDEAIAISVSVRLIVQGCRVYNYQVTPGPDLTPGDDPGEYVDVASVTYPGGIVGASRTRARTNGDRD